MRTVEDNSCAASRAKYDGRFPDRWWQVWWQRWGIKGTRGDPPVSSFSNLLIILIHMAVLIPHTLVRIFIQPPQLSSLAQNNKLYCRLETAAPIIRELNERVIRWPVFRRFRCGQRPLPAM